MSSQINDLVAARDIESLYEIMTEDDEWMNQLDAAEGLVKLGDRRGYEFLLTATLSDDDEILEVANEIMESPELEKMRREVEAERERNHRAHLETAKQRLQKGGKVYRYKMVYLPTEALMGEDPFGEGFDVPALDDKGLEGWEVVHVTPSGRTALSRGADILPSGSYFLLKKEVLPSESADLN
ncbi:MAG: hypothetical protein ABI986_01730 [Chloroflexota bacterium]